MHMLTKCHTIWDFRQRRIVVTDVSGHPTRPIFKSQAVQAVGQEHLTKRNCIVNGVGAVIGSQRT